MPWSGPSVLTQAALPLTVYCTAGTSVACAEPDARFTVPPYEPTSVVVVQVPLNWRGPMLPSSAGASVNFGPVAQPPQTPALQPRTRYWYAVPAVLPICRNRRGLVAQVFAGGTGWTAPR